MKKINLLLISTMLIVGCAKKVEPTPEVVETQPIIETVGVDVVETSVEIVNNTQIIEAKIPVEVVIDLSLPTIDEDAEEAPLVEEVVKTPPTPQKEIKPSFEFDQIFPDSVWTNYMTKRGDYLSLIAYNEYGNANEWRRIYNWNKKHWEERKIGPNKENPNFIYPYKELDLKKPAENAIEWAYEFNIHIVTEGESLWTIAQAVYND
jgi:nucleoid-associated protein YgaU